LFEYFFADEVYEVAVISQGVVRYTCYPLAIRFGFAGEIENLDVDRFLFIKVAGRIDEVDCP
jgi:hypothetical protein